jgi:Flp pilus assembly protein TadD
MKLILYLFLITPAIAQSELTLGRSSYQSGDFKTAISHFQRVLQDSPENAECNYWMGRSYETLADIATPFGRKDRSLARAYLAKAAELAPNHPEYRRELFDFLLETNHQRQAFAILMASAESDPEYPYMLSRFRQTRELNASLSARIGKPFQLVTSWR